jgi:GH3 auxin-responsive promoter
MDPRATAANLLWAGASVRAWRRFRRALRNPEAVQRTLLERYLVDNRDTALGRQYGFAELAAMGHGMVEAYQQRVPLSTYDDLEPFIKRVAGGESAVLSRARVSRLVPSSGSTAAAKLVPHTETLQQEFSRGVDAWIADLYLRHPTLVGGPAYWSVTPSVSFEAVAAARLGASAAAVPVGFEEDSAYLGGLRREIVARILAVPGEIRRLSDPAAFRYATLLFLVRARELRLMSVWHPSFLTQLLEALPDALGRIVDDLARGTLTPPGPISSDAHAALAGLLQPDPQRATELRRLTSADARAVWPHLTLVSCWGDGPARPYASRLADCLPGVEVQPKGLIATEALVSLPFGDKHPLAIRSHFFEFLDPDGSPRLAHELAAGVEYTAVVTTGGGLYRYRLGDRVRVTGWAHATPSVEFIGRSDAVSDRFGEKLSDGFVTSVLAELFAREPAPRFAMLAPESLSGGIAYTLFVEPDGPLPASLAAALERALRQNPHYAWCVDLGQLRPARVVRVGPHADRVYLEACVSRGQRLGDVKPASLHTESGWEERLGQGCRLAV